MIGLGASLKRVPVPKRQRQRVQAVTHLQHQPPLRLPRRPLPPRRKLHRQARRLRPLPLLRKAAMIVPHGLPLHVPVLWQPAREAVALLPLPRQHSAHRKRKRRVRPG